MDRTLTLIGAVVGFVVALGGGIATPIIVAVIKRHDRDDDIEIVTQGQTVGYADKAISASERLAEAYRSERDDYRARLGRANRRLSDLGEPTF